MSDQVVPGSSPKRSLEASPASSRESSPFQKRLRLESLPLSPALSLRSLSSLSFATDPDDDRVLSWQQRMEAGGDAGMTALEPSSPRDTRGRRNELWQAIKSDYQYLMDEGIMDTCKSADSDMSGSAPDDPDPFLDVSLSEFSRLHGELTEWIRHVQADTKRHAHSLSERHLYESYHEEFLLRIPRRAALGEYARRLVRRFPSLCGVVNVRLDALNSEWDELQQIVTPDQQSDSATVVEDINEDLQGLKLWLEQVERRLEPLDGGRDWTLDMIGEELTTHQVLQSDIESKKHVVWSVRKLCAQIEDAGLLERAEQSEKRWHRVWLASLERQCMLEEAVQQGRFRFRGVPCSEDSEYDSDVIPFYASEYRKICVTDDGATSRQTTPSSSLELSEDTGTDSALGRSVSDHSLERTPRVQQPAAKVVTFASHDEMLDRPPREDVGYSSEENNGSNEDGGARRPSQLAVDASAVVGDDNSSTPSHNDKATWRHSMTSAYDTSSNCSELLDATPPDGDTTIVAGNPNFYCMTTLSNLETTDSDTKNVTTRAASESESCPSRDPSCRREAIRRLVAQVNAPSTDETTVSSELRRWYRERRRDRRVRRLGATDGSCDASSEATVDSSSASEDAGELYRLDASYSVSEGALSSYIAQTSTTTDMRRVASDTCGLVSVPRRHHRKRKLKRVASEDGSPQKLGPSSFGQRESADEIEANRHNSTLESFSEAAYDEFIEEPYVNISDDACEEKLDDMALQWEPAFDEFLGDDDFGALLSRHPNQTLHSSTPRKNAVVEDSDSDVDEFVYVILESRKQLQKTAAALRKNGRELGVSMDVQKYNELVATCLTNISCLEKIAYTLESRRLGQSEEVCELHSIISDWNALREFGETRAAQARWLTPIQRQISASRLAIESVAGRTERVCGMTSVHQLEEMILELQSERADLQLTPSRLRTVAGNLQAFTRAHSDVDVSKMSQDLSSVTRELDDSKSALSERLSRLQRQLLVWHQWNDTRLAVGDVLKRQRNRLEGDARLDAFELDDVSTQCDLLASKVELMQQLTNSVAPVLDDVTLAEMRAQVEELDQDVHFVSAESSRLSRNVTRTRRDARPTGEAVAAADAAAAAADPTRRRRRRGSMFWRVLKAAIPLQLFALFVLGVACFFEPECSGCARIGFVVNPQFRYVRGPPPF